ncbi:MAG TPA: GreA/GreB family elongation factor [Candidatus Avoscillospira avicola]|uniref:Transcription elongation factor GreA n=1 Tax=Candidatus Avoscillospira avicola TaxID=2840706 RepID=A0A9D1DH77_9FIRM|nr:GreA/GreB family elongation factor [Candidatus Avoscillospira avicola]
MPHELTPQDIEIMQKELDYRRIELMPELLEEVKRTRAFGDLSENYEYKAAKQAQNANRKRIRYLTRMIQNSTVLEDTSAADEVGLFDQVELYFEEDDEVQTVQVVSTVRCDPRQGRISRESPLGRVLLGRRVGDKVTVHVSETYSYEVEVRSITKTQDDGSAPVL